MADLQCPAQIFVLPTAGARDPAVLAAAVVRLRGERVVGVLGSPADREAVERAAAALEVPARLAEDVEDLDEVADRYPGEAVVLVRSWPTAALVLLERDVDGWTRPTRM